MTLPASGPISLSQVNTELQLSSTATISLNDANVRTLFNRSFGTISMSDGYGKAYTVAGNSGILTSGTSFTLPSTSGLTIGVIAIGGGAGGGGGSGRTSYSGYFTGGGGGGAGGNSYRTLISVTPGQTISFSVGSGGSAGSARDGVYSGGSNGGNGANSYVAVNGTLVAIASGGIGGLVSPNATGGDAGYTSAGTQLITPVAGGVAANGATTGGQGARGYELNTTLAASSVSAILTSGNYGTISGAAGSGVPPTAGTIYGAGGGGGGCAQSDIQNSANIASNAGTTGAVFIWWGYA